MVIQHHVTGFEEFLEYMKQFTPEQVVYVFYSGSKLPDGNSWCDDCVRAWPIVEVTLSTVDRDAHFVYVEVGDRSFWKDYKCPFRTNAATRLNVLPTLVRWKGFQKLEGEQCEKVELVEMLFTDDE